MPYKSQAQERYFNANRGKLEAQGVDVGEWNSASKGKSLPKRAAAKALYDGGSPATGDRIPNDGEFIHPISQSVSERARVRLKKLLQGDSGAPAVPYTGKQLPAALPADMPPAHTGAGDSQGWATQYDGATGGTGTGNTDPNSVDSNFGQNLGGQMNPWDTSWGSQGGNYSAPLDKTANAGINNIQGFAEGGMGLDNARQYTSDALQGKYLTAGSNPYMAQEIQGMRVLKDDQDTQQHRAIGSSMAAGGNALSGARMEADQRYSNQSDANFNQNVGGILAKQYQNERGLQSTAANQANNLANTQEAGFRDQLNAGMIPTNMAQNDLDRQRADYERTTGNMMKDYTGNGQVYNDLMNSRYSNAGAPSYGDSAASQLLAGLLGSGQNGNNGLIKSLTDLLKKNPNSAAKPAGGSQSGGGGSPKAGGAPATNPDGSPKTNANGDPVDENGNTMMKDNGDGTQSYTDSLGQDHTVYTDDTGQPVDVYVDQNGNLSYNSDMQGPPAPDGTMTSGDNGTGFDNSGDGSTQADNGGTSDGSMGYADTTGSDGVDYSYLNGD